MRIALLFYGRISSFREQYSKIFDVIGRENTVDIFSSSDYEPSERIAEFRKLYNPVKSVHKRIIHDHYQYKYPRYDRDMRYDFNYSNECHFINQMRVYMLLDEHMKNTNIHYDMVICTRFDLNYFSIIPKGLPGNNTVYIPFDSDYEGGINDHFAMGSVEVMRKYCYLYKNLVFLIQNRLSPPHAENLNKANIIYNNLNLARFPLVYKIGF